MPSSSPGSRYDAVVVGGGHNGLVAAAYIAGAGRSCLVLERREALGGAAVSAHAFPGFDACISRYSYLVSLLPSLILGELGLSVALAQRRVSSYTPDPRVGGRRGLFVDREDRAATRASFRAVTGGDGEHAAWEEFYAMTRRIARAVFPTLTEPLRSRAQLRALVDDDAAWEAVFENPLGDVISRGFADDLVAGVVLTDALIGTFAAADDTDLRQNRCFLYHVIGGGTGDWQVPIGGMGSLSSGLAHAAGAAGAELCTRAEVLGLAPDADAVEVRFTDGAGEFVVRAGHVLVNAAPAELARLLVSRPDRSPEGAQLKVNLLLARLPRLKDSTVAPERAFAGTFHVNETAEQLQRAHDEAAGGDIPSLPPCETYCHSLTDPTILGPTLCAQGFHTLTI
ncbi:MAG: NAD(P)/FAD-dependent oxidoreductase, partial [Actinomycetota bacterium]|nr:NAD(P)/FAD-dependent oxidoreductase [Actinomycetota bacterium]